MQISLVGLIVLCITLVFTTGLITGFVRFTHESPQAASVPTPAGSTSDLPPSPMPPWGELTTTDVSLEQPEEYVAFAAMAAPGTSWIFEETDPEKIRALLLDCGLTAAQADGVFAAGKPTPDGKGWKSTPGDELVLSLTPEARAKLYAVLAHNPANTSLKQPYFIPEGTFDSMFAGSGVDIATTDLVRRLLYPQGRSQCFSDLGLVLQHIPDDKAKLDLVKALTRETAVLVRLRVRPDTDIDKLLGYWTATDGARAKDARPLLEALKRLHDGGSIGVGFLLPAFARERLYTTPLPTKPGDVVQDCHWSALNFFNDTPDERFADQAFVGHYIDENYYQIARPTMLGDLVFFLNDKNEVIHSAVHIADDLVFTKNGENYAQPWILTRMKNLEATYMSAGNFKTVFYRRKNL
ncbi:MAG: hypothetical protein ACREKL_13775 [Chthoniobacterales bacterium]